MAAPPRKWNHKHIILVTLTGTLVAIAIAAAISISLSPAHIFFSIENPSFGEVADTKYYNFTLVSHNSSPRMAVLYGALSAEIWYSQTAWVPAMVDRSALQEGRRQPPRRSIPMNVSAEYWQSEEQAPPQSPGAGGEGGQGGGGGNKHDNNKTDTDKWSYNCTVLVAANVWFKSGWIITRSYNVRANCPQVNFHNTSNPVQCTQG